MSNIGLTKDALKISKETRQEEDTVLPVHIVVSIKRLINHQHRGGGRQCVTLFIVCLQRNNSTTGVKPNRSVFNMSPLSNYTITSLLMVCSNYETRILRLHGHQNASLQELTVIYCLKRLRAEYLYKEPFYAINHFIHTGFTYLQIHQNTSSSGYVLIVISSTMLPPQTGELGDIVTAGATVCDT